MKLVKIFLIAIVLVLPGLVRAEDSVVPTRQIRQKIKETRAVLLGAVVTNKATNSLTVTKDGKLYTVDTSAAKLRRRFWGSSSLDEIQVNDLVNIHGRYTDEAKTAIKAVLVRDISIQKRPMVRIGEVKSVSSTGFVVIDRDIDYTVTVGSAKLVNRKQETMALSDIGVGHKVRVHGLWDSANHTVASVVQVKDFSLPAK